jgi:hypothetical protein
MSYANRAFNAVKIADNIISPAPSTINIQLNTDCSIDFIDSKTKYIPLKTLKQFHDCDVRVKIILGPYGSGKSSGLCCDIIKRAIEMPKCRDGVRRLHATIVRKTYSQIESTTLATWNQWGKKTGVSRKRDKPNLERWHTFCDHDGLIEIWLLFLALDNEDDLQKLQSLETTLFYVNEGQHIHNNYISHMLSRTGRYPKLDTIDLKSVKKWHEGKVDLYNETIVSKSPFWSGVNIDSNSPKLSHWMPEMELKIKENGETDTRIFHQPPALLKNDLGEYYLNPDVENIENLPKGASYYFEMINRGDEYIKVYAQGYYGTVATGKRIYDKYNDELHAVDNIEIVKNVPVIYGVDYGKIAPAILICQWVAGQLRCIKEFCGLFMYIEDLAKEFVIPYLKQNNCLAGATGKDDCSQTFDGRKILLDLNLDVVAARTNKIEPRLASVNNLLGRINSAGKPTLLISKIGCPNLRDGFNGEYKHQSRMINGQEEYLDAPDKVHPYSDIHDSLQYVALEFVEEEKVRYDFSSFRNTEKY